MIEQVIFANLVENETFARKTIPFLKQEYFSSRADKALYGMINGFVDQYNKLPTKQALLIELDSLRDHTEDEVKSIRSTIESIEPKEVDEQWLVDQTEKFCQDRAIYNAITKAIQISDGKGNESRGAIPQLLSDALAVSFDQNIGHDYMDDADARYEYYHDVVERVPFDLDILNKITKGGLPRKTLNIALAGTGVGKSLFMCHCASGHLARGLNVLYITMEMAEEEIAKRIDANLLNVTMDELLLLPKDVFEKKMDRVKKHTKGKLLVKQYPTSSAGSANFRHLMNELKLKKSFKPDVVYIDYLNICTSSRMKMGGSVNSYTYVKAIAEELRGLAIEFEVPIISATQTTRSGYSNTDVGLEDTSESFGLPATADFMFALISTEELQEMNQLMVKQLKNRYSDLANLRRFVIGIDRAKMRLYDVEQSAQNDVVNHDAPDTGMKGRGDKKFDKAVFDSFG